VVHAVIIGTCGDNFRVGLCPRFHNSQKKFQKSRSSFGPWVDWTLRTVGVTVGRGWTGSGVETRLTGGRGWTASVPGHLHTETNFCRDHRDVTMGDPELFCEQFVLLPTTLYDTQDSPPVGAGLLINDFDFQVINTHEREDTFSAIGYVYFGISFWHVIPTKAKLNRSRIFFWTRVT